MPPAGAPVTVDVGDTPALALVSSSVIPFLSLWTALTVLDLFRADWHLREISAYAQDFNQPHRDTEDLRAHWASLNTYLPVAQNWPRLVGTC
ncbi:MAG: hypothetical protein J2P17_18250 [Mycobacterium sp.]|nr:hypothetical protein [Mycobacterium sp.]